MKYRILGRTDVRVSEIGFGAWAIGESWWGVQPEKDSIDALHKALDTTVSELPDLTEDLLRRLRQHAWLRGFWYSGK